MAEDKTLRVGLLGIWLEAYGSQFAGLEDRVKGCVAQAEERLAGRGRTFVPDCDLEAMLGSQCVDHTLAFCGVTSGRWRDALAGVGTAPVPSS